MKEKGNLVEQGRELTIQVTYSCGCGFASHSPTAARQHVIDYVHTVVVNGQLKPLNGPERKHHKKFIEEDEL